MSFASLTKARLCTAAAAVLGVVATSAGAANLHCAPDVIVTNEKPASIKVLNFKYKVATSGDKIFTEGLANKKLAANGEEHTWKSQKLNNAATGVVVTATAIEYKNDNSGAGDGYGPPKTSQWINRSYSCNDSHTYPHTITTQDP
ncbi:MAG TPA: hypothetical protein VFK10_14810 [Burkholderiaceae bacterium]|nr:hypothetical protein [Burkholderiaceae bacterium]